MTSEADTILKILQSNGINDLDEIEYGSQCYDELMDYFADEMPYGVMKARDGDPCEWITYKVADLGILDQFDDEYQQERANHMQKSFDRGEM
mgnify:CR=1 FL=1